MEVKDGVLRTEGPDICVPLVVAGQVRYLIWRNENLRFIMKEAMQLDATLHLPDGKQIPVVVELDATQLENSLADTGLADVVARAVEVLGSRPRALAWLRTPVGGLDGKTPLEVMAAAEGRQQVEDILGRVEHGVFG